jgi:GNAT superfamily N-acetyltransferase
MLQKHDSARFVPAFVRGRPRFVDMPVKGQKLLVRPIEAADATALRTFASRYGGDAEPAAGLVGKLVGELAAVLTMEIERDAVRIVNLTVAEELRRKRVARVMLNELAAVAAKLEREWLVAPLAHAAFLERVGFVEQDGVMKRRVG